MRLAFIYAGQGSQKVGMGQDFYDKYDTYKKIFDEAKLDFDLKKCSFEGPEEMLNQTQYTQGCMVAYAVGVTRLLFERGIRPEVACGLSLGEYSALYAAGCFSENQVIKIAQFRGNAMQQAAEGRTAKMLAVLGADRDTVTSACKEANEELIRDKDFDSVVAVANYNCPGQIVLSGDAKAVDIAEKILKEKGVKKVVPLKVSGPFHTKLMAPAGEKLYEYLKSEQIGKMEIPVIFNATGKELEDKSIEEMLKIQVQSSVYFEDSIKAMKEKGIDTIIEIGPGKALSKFVAKTDKTLKCYSIDSAEDFEKVCELLVGGKNE